MNKLLWLLKWILKAAIFFTLFAFALNNQHEARVYFFFGTSWQAPQVLIVLIVFAMGVSVGALGMVPRWWRSRKSDSPHQNDIDPLLAARSQPPVVQQKQTPV